MIGSWEYETLPSDFAGHPQDGQKSADSGLCTFSSKEFMSDAYDDGYYDVTGVDIVEAVLETMRRQGSALAAGM